jgi:hypothetical protein
LVATAPAIRHAGTHFLGGKTPGHGEAAPGDHLQTAYHFWLVGDDLEHGRYPWRDPYSFRPETHWTLNPAAWPFGAVFWPLWRALGLVLAWNVFVLLSFVGAGGLTCAWLRELRLSRAAALAGGLAFAIAPYRVAQSTGHLLGPISMLLPLALFALERGLRASRWWLLLSVAAIASIPLSGQVHLALGAVPFYVAYALVRSRDRWSIATAAVAVTAAIGAGVFIRLEVIAGSIAAGGRSLSSVDTYSADWPDFVVRHQRHGLEPFVFLGWLLPAVAVLGLVVLWWRGRRALAAVFGAGALVPMVLALGTTTPLYRVARFVFPPLRYPRVPERLMPVTCLCLAALVAYVIAEAERRGAGRHLVTVPYPVVVGALCVLLLFVDLRVSLFGAASADPGNRAYAAIRREPPGRVAEVPYFRPGSDLGSPYLYYETQIHRERPGGYSTTAPKATDRVAQALVPLDCGDWSAGRARVLRGLGVTTIAFHRGLFKNLGSDTGWFAWRGLIRNGWKRIARDGAVTVLTRHGWVPPNPAREPSHGELLFCDGWYPNDGRGRQTNLEHALLWVYDSGDLRLFLESGTPLPVAFSVDGQRVEQRVVSQLAEVRVPVGGVGWHLVAVDSPLPKVNGRRGGPHLVGYARS